MTKFCAKFVLLKESFFECIVTVLVTLFLNPATAESQIFARVIESISFTGKLSGRLMDAQRLAPPLSQDGGQSGVDISNKRDILE